MVGRQVKTARSLARFDRLTGLLQRAAFEDDMATALLAARRRRQPLGLAFLDIDHFKSINDRGGHPAGDRVLRSFADTLRRVTRDADRIGRWGGEAFVVLTPDADAAGTRIAMQRLQAAIAATAIEAPPLP
ncbi:MAG: GGDEF domain-containing protein [Pseudomonadota bacterium]|nr:GGDEF domain-containing protein [Pseudomonadota bacterium]